MVVNNKTIYRYGFIAEPKKARKAFVCRECHGVIRKGEIYYQVVIGGGGLRSLKFPNRLDQDCLDAFLEKFRESWEKKEALSKKLMERGANNCQS